MVSLYRLLAAAEDSLLEEPAPPLLLRTPRDCILPPVLSQETVPKPLREVLNTLPPSDTIQPSASSSSILSPSFNSSNPLPLQRILQDLGIAATAPDNMATLARTLAHFGRPSEAAVASALLFLSTAVPPETTAIDTDTMFQLFALFCRDQDIPDVDSTIQQAIATTSSSSSEWHVDVFVKAVVAVAAQFNSPLDWRMIIHYLDVEGLESQLTRNAFIDIAKAYISGTNGNRLPADCILDTWSHPNAQICIISHALASPELIDWDVLELFEGATIEDAQIPYARVTLIEKLIELDARELLKRAIQQSTEIVMLSLTCTKPKSNTSMQQKLAVNMLSSCLNAYPSSEKAVRQMWNIAPSLVQSAMIARWKKDHNAVRPILRMCLEMQILFDVISTSTPFEFALDLALYAYREGLFPLENWIMKVILARGYQAMTECIIFLAQKIRPEDLSIAATLSLDGIRIIFRCLATRVRSLANAAQAQELIDSVQGVHESYVRINPRVKDLSPALDAGDPKVLLGGESATQLAGIDGESRTVVPASPEEQTTSSETTSSSNVLLLLAPKNSEGEPCDFDSALDQEAQMFFQQLYHGSITVEQAFERLRRLQSSNVVHEKQVFNCAMYTLFDEYRFLNNYPDEQLRLAGMLFGSVIQYSLLNGTLLGFAANCVLDALKSVETSPQQSLGRLVKFGLCALERFKNRLHEWPYYCSQILELPRLADYAPELIARVRKSLERSGGVIPSMAEREIGLVGSELGNGVDRSKPKLAPVPEQLARKSPNMESASLGIASPPASATVTPMKNRESPTDSSRASPSRTPDGTNSVSGLNLIELLGMTREEANQVITPDEETQDRIKFIFNNLSHDTMDQKVSEMISILSNEYQRYFSVYIVVKRAPTEPNFHHLYLAMLERMSLKIPHLFPMVFETSYKRVRILLSGDKGRGTSAERQVLKNLGSWIGSLTLARNKPILRRDLDLKELLLDAYSNGRLTIIVPFVAKVLDACPRSKIFKETNPWVRGILSLMKEIHEVPDFKLNIKFELQMLCKNALKIDLNAIVPSDLLRTRPAPDKLRNPDYNTKKTISGSPPRTSPSPSPSPSPDNRRGYGTAASRGAPPVFSTIDSQPGSTTPIHTMGSAVSHATSGRMEVPPSLASGNIPHIASEGVGDLSNLLSTVSLSSANASTAYVPRTSLHATVPMGAPSGPQTTTTSRVTNGVNQTEPTIIPNLAQYITVSPTLAIFQNSPNLKRLLPYAIDRAIREIIQPVVERSCAIAFLTTKELTLKDFATETDFSKVRRAAVQMVQQLAGSLALVTSKEPLRVSMNNQLVNILNSTVNADQAVVEQTAQIVCMQNLEVGCAVIERHAKEKAARDLTEKLTPSSFARRATQQTPQHFAYGGVPGQDVVRVYEDFARVNRLTQNQNQPQSSFSSAPSNNVPTSYGSLTNSSIPSPTGALNVQQATQQASHSNPVMLDERPSATNLNSFSSTRGSLSETSQNIGKAHQEQIDTLNHNVVGNRQAPAPSFQAEVPLSSALFGSPLPQITPSNNVSDVIFAVISAHRDANSTSASAAGQSMTSVSASEDEALSTQKVLERFNVVYPHLVSIISDLTSSDAAKDLLLSDVRPDHEIHSLWTQIPAAVKRSVTADEAGMAVAQKVFKGLYEGDSNLYREVHVLVLEGLRESCRRLSKELVSWISFSEERKRFHKECTLALMRSGSLLNKTSYDEALAKFIDNGRNITALDFACHIVRKAVLEEPLATQAEMKLTLDLMEKVGNKPTPPHLPSAPEGLLLLVDIARNTTHAPNLVSSAGASNNDVHQTPGPKQSREPEPSDPDGSWQSVGAILLDWQALLTSDSSARSMPNPVMVGLLTQITSDILSNEETRERFFRILVELVVGVTFAALNETSLSKEVPKELTASPYTCVEVAVRLVSSLCRFPELYGQDSNIQATSTLCGFLTALVKNILKRDSESDFRPHFRLFTGMISEIAYEMNTKEERNGAVARIEADARTTSFTKRLAAISSLSDALQFLDDKDNGFLQIVQDVNSGEHYSFNFNNLKVLAAFTAAFSMCSPMHVSGFAFSWLQLISNKELLPSFLSIANVSGWPLFRHLLELILSFLSPFLDSDHSMTRGIKTLYCGLLRVLLVLLHDFPEFLCTYHMTFCDVIPENCVQLRNLVLASFPQEMRLPDPFSPELNIESIPEMAYPPIILSDFTSPLEETGLRKIIDKYVSEGISFRAMDIVMEVETHLIDANSSSEIPSYNSRRTGAMVLYVGQQALRNIQSGEGHVMSGSATKFLVGLTRAISPFGRHTVLNAITNQLRYPNNNTMYYSNLMLLLFHDGDEVIKEQIARVLVERLIANRPHPWGLLITFVQLIKRSEYNFWNHEFVRCSPEIEQVFKNLARFCFVPNEQQSIVVSS